MPHEGMDHASRGKKYCIATEEMLRRDGTGECIAMQKKGLFRTENYELRGRKL